MQAEEQGDRLATDEIVIMIIALLVGGNNSTAHLIGNAILTLARHPEALAQLRANPELIRTANRGSAALREPGAGDQPRRPRRIEIDGQTIEPGQGITCSSAPPIATSASSRPDELDLTRQAEPAPDLRARPALLPRRRVARAEAQIAVQTVVQRCAGLELVSDEADWQEGFSFRGLEDAAGAVPTCLIER